MDRFAWPVLAYTLDRNIGGGHDARADDLNQRTMEDYLNAPAAKYTPTFTVAGADASSYCSTLDGRYAIGRGCYVSFDFYIVFNAALPAGVITIGLPVPAASQVGGNTQVHMVGTTGAYLVGQAISSSTFGPFTAADVQATNAAPVLFNAAGHRITGSGTYRGVP